VARFPERQPNFLRNLKTEDVVFGSRVDECVKLDRLAFVTCSYRDHWQESRFVIPSQFPMSWVKDAITALEAGMAAQVRPQGGSMRGRIESGQLVTIAPVTPERVKLDDVVLIRWKGNYILHIVREIGEAGFLIGNNLGKINGWAARDDVIGVVTDVSD
jgi:hypothetical protein